jgi:hypothetical protein
MEKIMTRRRGVERAGGGRGLGRFAINDQVLREIPGDIC